MHFNHDTRCEHYYYQGEKRWKKLLILPFWLTCFAFFELKVQVYLWIELVNITSGLCGERKCYRLSYSSSFK